MSDVKQDAGYVYSFEELLDTTGYIIYRNIGYSMMPLLRQRRDIIEIRKKNPATRCKRYDVVLYKQGNKYILHRILKVRSHDYVICGDHNIKREYGITDNQILGVLTRVKRDGRIIDVRTDKLYKLYVHLWCDFYYIRVAILYIEMITRAVKRKLKMRAYQRRSKKLKS